MILKTFYDDKELVEKVWYDSSSVLYSEFYEHQNDNFGELFVTFKNGSTYHYSNVDMVHDYILFKNGGTEGSQGKALNQFIKNKYQFEKMEAKDVRLLMEEMNKLDDPTRKLKTYFVSGHRDITETEFEKYKAYLYNIVISETDYYFVVADYEGADFMVQNYLMDELKIDPDRVTIYHMGDEPMNINPKITRIKGGFSSDEERDTAMTRDSVFDIAFVRDNTVMSGTAMNILRRFLL